MSSVTCAADANRPGATACPDAPANEAAGSSATDCVGLDAGNGYTDAYCQSTCAHGGTWHPQCFKAGFTPRDDGYYLCDCAANLELVRVTHGNTLLITGSTMVGDSQMVKLGEGRPTRARTHKHLRACVSRVCCPCAGHPLYLRAYVSLLVAHVLATPCML